MEGADQAVMSSTGVMRPGLRACTAPPTERILEIFAPISRHHLYQHDALHQQILNLLGLSTNTYNETKS